MRKLLTILSIAALTACTTAPDPRPTEAKGCRPIPNAACFQADLRDMDVAGANMTGADLRGAQLQGVDFSGTNLTGADLTGAIFDAETRWPAGFNPEEFGAIKEDGRIRGGPQIHEPYKTEPIIDR